MVGFRDEFEPLPPSRDKIKIALTETKNEILAPGVEVSALERAQARLEFWREQIGAADDKFFRDAGFSAEEKKKLLPLIDGLINLCDYDDL